MVFGLQARIEQSEQRAVFSDSHAPSHIYIEMQNKYNIMQESFDERLETVDNK